MLTNLTDLSQLGEWLVVEWTAEPNPERLYQAPLHRHHTCEEAWYVLEGALGFLIEGEEFIAGPGDLMFVEAGKSHTFWCEGATEARYLIFMTPKINQLVHRIHQASDRSWPALEALFAEYDSELIG